MWYRLVVGINVQFCIVWQGLLCIILLLFIIWFEIYVNLWLFEKGLCVDLVWCQVIVLGYY